MTALNLILGPIVGGVIGYITNALAIRMLFRPYTAKYIGRWHVPFTPGIIPKEKGRIAASLGSAISDNLMNADTLGRYLLSDQMVSRLRTAVETFLDRQAMNTDTVQQTLARWLGADEAARLTLSVRRELASQVAERLAASDLPAHIAAAVARHTVGKLRGDGFESIMPNPVKLLGEGFRNKLSEMVESGLTKLLTGRIASILTGDGAEMVMQLIDHEAEALAETPVCRLLEGRQAEIAQLGEAVANAYRIAVGEQLPRILAAIDIPKVIEERINEMDVRETEQLIFQVMDRELKAIIWLGALLGAIMGVVNGFF